MPPLSCWEFGFPRCEPVGHLLRTALSERWVRFHSLPEGKRYPEDEAEYATLLNRHNRILGQLTGSESNVVLLTTGFSNSPIPARDEPALATLDPNATPWRSVAMHELDVDFENPNYWHVFASDWKWYPGLFNPIIRLVTEWTLANVMIANIDCRWLLHPYDGGMDVITESTKDRDLIKSLYSDWLSSEPNGL